MPCVDRSTQWISRQHSAFLEGEVTTVAHDDVVEQPDAEELRAVGELPRHRDVVLARFRVSRRVAVTHDEPRGAPHQDRGDGTPPVATPASDPARRAVDNSRKAIGKSANSLAGLPSPGQPSGTTRIP